MNNYSHQPLSVLNFILHLEIETTWSQTNCWLNELLSKY